MEYENNDSNVTEKSFQQKISQVRNPNANVTTISNTLSYLNANETPILNAPNDYESFLLSFLSELNFTLNSAHLCEETSRVFGRKASTAEDLVNQNYYDDLRSSFSRNVYNNEEDYSSSNRYSNPNCEREEDSEGLSTLTVLKTEKYKYLGEIKNGVRDGFGICYYPRGELYIGQWREGKKEGKGKVLLPTGEIHQGELKENLFDGFVEIINHKKGVRINGFASRGRLRGEIVAKIGDVRIEGLDVDCLFLYNENGIDLNDRFDYNVNNYGVSTSSLNCNKPICKIIFSEDNYYHGEIETSLINSPGVGLQNCQNFNNNFFGINVLPNEYSFMGELDCKNLQPNGYCEFYYPDCKFFGFFKNAKKNGFGLQIFSDGKLVFGKYCNDLKVGPFFHMTKTSLSCSKMEIYYLGFKSKVVEKHDNIKKYLPMNYPEFAYLLAFNFKPILDKLIDLKDEDILIVI